LTLDRITADAIAVAEFVRKHLRARGLRCSVFREVRSSASKLLSGPNFFRICWNRARRELDAFRSAGYAMVLEQARAAGDQDAVAELEKIGAPPYKNAADDAIKSKYPVL
jgi:hypothetical protein